jgi:RimJ/RimL family protein N-acetyltransferase
MKQALNRTIALHDGARLMVRPIAPGDRAALAATYAGLSVRSLYRRFMFPKRELTPRELTYFTEVDHVSHEALLAIDPCTGAIVAEARYAAWYGDPRRADVAAVVADAWHGRGLGRLLMARLVARARDAGLERLTASMLATNEPARGLMRSLGFTPLGTHAGESEFELRLAPALAVAA